MVLVTKKKKQPTIHEKRRHGHHHHTQSRRYHNTYWPYLPLMLIVTLGVAFNSLWPTLQNAVLGYATNTTINGLLLETNQRRAANHAGHVALNAQLSAAAQAKAKDMAERNYWSHSTPDGQEPWVFVVTAGYEYEAAGENLAYGFDSSGATVNGWMNSPSHRANLVNKEYEDVGFGIANAENYQGKGPQTIVVAMYGKRLQSEPAPTPVAANSTPQQPAGIPQAESAPASAPSERTPAPSTRPAQAASASPSTEGTPAEAAEPQAQRVARLQLFTAENTAWAVFAATVIAAVAAGVFILRHSIFWHRVLVKGERFAAHHHVFDIVLVTLAVAAFVLTRTAGTIH